MSMELVEALRSLNQGRAEQVVIATMGAAREWSRLSDHPRDFIYVPSSMGQAPTLGLGLALARPDLRVIVLNGDGCMLMNLGCLVTIGRQRPANYALVVVQNGVYEITGGQPTAGGRQVDFAAMARAAGFPAATCCHDMEAWLRVLPDVLAGPGPLFVALQVEPVSGDDLLPRPPCPMREQVTRFQAALGPC